VKMDTLGQICVPNISLKSKLSIIEADLLNFLLSKENILQVYVLRGHAGVGKSTMLKYIAHYLYFLEPDLNSAFLPVYVALSDDRKRIKQMSISDELFAFLDEQLYLKTRLILRKYLEEHHQPVLAWVNDYSTSGFFAKFPEEVLSTWNSADTDDLLTGLESEKDRRMFFFDILRYYSRNVRRVVIIIDNVDSFNEDIHRLCLNYADEKISQFIPCVIAMRMSTYMSIDSKISEKRDRTSPLVTYSLNGVKEILKKRVEHLDQPVSLESGIRIKASPKDIAAAFVDLIYHPTSLDTLANMSNQNLNVLFRKVRLMGDSDYFDDKLLQRELMEAKLDVPSKRTPLWVLYSLIFGNYSGSFKSSNYAATAGIVNVFCNQSSSRTPYTHFSRLHLLSRVFTRSEPGDKWIKVKDIYDEYSALFGDDVVFTATFFRTLYRLIQSGLIFAHSCNRYEDERDIVNLILKDVIQISNAGQFYLLNLINKVDYLYFMKDDINWQGDRDLDYARLGTDRPTKWKNTLLSLIELMDLEYKMLARIREKTGNSSSVNLIGLYSEKFSAQRLDPDRRGLLFTRTIWKEMKRYINNIDVTFIVRFSELSKRIENTLKAKNELEKAFLS